MRQTIQRKRSRSHSQPATNRAQFFQKIPEENALHTIGYQVFSNAVVIDDLILTHMHEICDKGLDRSIFNFNEQIGKNDHNRRQAPLRLNNETLQQFDAQIQKLVREKINTALIPSNPVVLHSRANCQAQAAHCDYEPDKAFKSIKSDAHCPLALLVCLQPETTLRVWPNSIKLFTKSESALKHIQPIEGVILQMNPGDVVVFRGDLVHAGSSYARDNVRIHYYLDSDYTPRFANRTWIINLHANEKMKALIQPIHETSQQTLHQ